MTVDEWNKIYIAIDGTFLTEKLIEEAYEIMNRQKTEIKDLKFTIKISSATSDKYRHEVERLQEAVNSAKKYVDESRQGVSEAIKEFGRFLIEKEKKGRIYTMDIPDYVQEFINK